MIKNTWDKNENASANKKEITVLKEHFPACFKEDGSFDIERFKEYLSEDINVVNEGYELKFLGKNYARDRKSTRLNSSHVAISYAVFCLKKKKDNIQYEFCSS